MKRLYFWCHIVTPHWLHTLSCLSREIGAEVLVYADSLAQIEERRAFGWGQVGKFPGVVFYTKQQQILSQIGNLPLGYHLVTNPFNDPFNKRLVSRLIQYGIPFGLQQSKPGLMAGRVGRLVRRIGYGLRFQSAMNAAQYILCHGEMCRSYLLVAGARRELLFLGGYFVPASTELPVRASRRDDESLKAVYLGQFIDRKAVLRLATAARLKLGKLPVEIDFIGTGPQEGELRKIHSSAYGRVLPPVAYVDVVPTLRTYDVLLLPSRADEWAVVVNEAIHAGCGVIVTDSCGASDLVKHGGCGEVVKNAEECIDVLARVASRRDIVRKWQAAAARLSPEITSSAAAKYLAKIILGTAHAVGPEAIRAPWAPEAGKGALHIAMVYHFFAHYRLPIIRELKRRQDIFLDCYGDITSARIDASIKPITLEELPDLNVTPVVAWRHWLWQRGLLRAMWVSRADVFVFLASPYFISTWLAVIMLRAKGRKVLYWGHLRFADKEQLLKRVFRSAFYKLATGWLSYGHQGKAGLVSAGVPGSAVHVIYNSLDYAAHLRLRNAPPLSNSSLADGCFSSPPTFICVSRLVYKRRLDMLFEAMAILAGRGRPTRLILVGEGPLREEMEDLVARLRLNVVFYGACYDEAVLRELYRQAIATVAPGEVGLTAIQSLSFGVPVITHGDLSTQMPEAESVVNGVTGWLFEKNSVAGLCQAMECALAADTRTMEAACFGMIDNFFNPRKQVQVIARASLGLPAMENDWRIFLDSLNNETLAKSTD